MFLQRRSGLSRFRGKGSRVNPTPLPRYRHDQKIIRSRGSSITSNFI